jgi:hypothetical protein
MSYQNKDKEESPLYLGLVIAAVLLVLGILVWIVAANRIVYGSLSPALTAGALWKVIPSDYGYSQWNSTVAAVNLFAPRPNAVTFLQWGSFVTTAFRPVAALLMLCYLGLLVAVGLRKNVNLKRRISANDLMLHSMRHFTGVAPVVAIRKQIAKDAHPLWRRQVTPDEVFLNFKVPRLAGGIGNGSEAKAGMPMMRDGRFDREVARAYFLGIEAVLPDGRIRSRMLGNQVVNLPTDAKDARSKVFADRMSNEGKALVGLWSAVAFGGKSGRDEFCVYRDKVNLSAYGTKDGIGDLSLAQPLYDKYRKHPMLNKLFAVHHWEHTFLFALLALAQKKGRYTTAEVLWLRPLNRVMFFSLNTRGSSTPHTESATTFAQHAYEVACAKANRLPLARDANGRLIHVIYADKAIDGLELECMRWVEAGSDNDDDWWQSDQLWSTMSPTISKYAQEVAASVPKADMPLAQPQPEDEADSRGESPAAAASGASSISSGSASEDAFDEFLIAKTLNP